MVAAADTPGGGSGTDPAEEAEGFRVAYDDLAAVAKGTKGPLDVLERARTQASAATLPSGSFGPSDEADGIVKYWNEALDQRCTEIGTCINVIADMAEKLRRTLDNYLASEEKNKDAVEESKKHAGEDVNDAPHEPYHEDPGLLRPDIK